MPPRYPTTVAGREAKKAKVAEESDRKSKRDQYVMAQIDGCASLHTSGTAASAQQDTSERAPPPPLPLAMLPKAGAMPRSTTLAPWTAALPLRMPSAPAQRVGHWPAQHPHQGMMPVTTGIPIAPPLVMPNSPSAIQFATPFFGAAPHPATTQYPMPFYQTSQWAQGQHHTNMMLSLPPSSLPLLSPLSSLPLLQHQVQPEQPTRPAADITLTRAELESIPLTGAELESILSPGDSSPQGSSHEVSQDAVEDVAAAAAATTAESQDAHTDSAFNMGSAVVSLSKLQDGVAAAAPAASSQGEQDEPRCPAPSASDSSSCQSSTCTVRNELTSLQLNERFDAQVGILCVFDPQGEYGAFHLRSMEHLRGLFRPEARLQCVNPSEPASFKDKLERALQTMMREYPGQLLQTLFLFGEGSDGGSFGANARDCIHGCDLAKFIMKHMSTVSDVVVAACNGKEIAQKLRMHSDCHLSVAHMGNNKLYNLTPEVVPLHYKQRILALNFAKEIALTEAELDAEQTENDTLMLYGSVAGIMELISKCRQVEVSQKPELFLSSISLPCTTHEKNDVEDVLKEGGSNGGSFGTFARWQHDDGSSFFKSSVNAGHHRQMIYTLAVYRELAPLLLTCNIHRTLNATWAAAHGAQIAMTHGRQPTRIAKQPTTGSCADAFLKILDANLEKVTDLTGVCYAMYKLAMETHSWEELLIQELQTLGVPFNSTSRDASTVDWTRGQGGQLGQMLFAHANAAAVALGGDVFSAKLLMNGASDNKSEFDPTELAHLDQQHKMMPMIISINLCQWGSLRVCLGGGTVYIPTHDPGVCVLLRCDVRSSGPIAISQDTAANSTADCTAVPLSLLTTPLMRDYGVWHARATFVILPADSKQLVARELRLQPMVHCSHILFDQHVRTISEHDWSDDELVYTTMDARIRPYLGSLGGTPKERAAGAAKAKAGQAGCTPQSSARSSAQFVQPPPTVQHSVGVSTRSSSSKPHAEQL